MRTISKVALAMAVSLGVSGCNSDDSKTPNIEMTQSQETTTIRFYKPDWSQTTLVYKVYQNDVEFSRVEMEKQENGWWLALVKGNRLEFAFEGDGNRVDLGGTQGCYPGDHYVCDNETDSAENFRTSAPEVWVQDGLVYSASPLHGEPDDKLTVLSLNLHTYQEFKTPEVAEANLTNEQAMLRVAQHGPLFDKVAAAINKLDPDVVCLQEVGEWHGKLNGEDPENIEFGQTDSNMVKQILSRLDNKNYNYFMDWSHFGWDVWLEGSAVLSKHPMSNTESRYISDQDNGTRSWWKSRNVPKAQIDLGGKLGKVNVFSIHTGWWDDTDEPFQDQFKRLTSWAAEVKEPKTTTLFCGDFNQVAATKEQQFITNGTGYTDQYSVVNPDGLADPTIGGTIDGWVGEIGKRIDLLVTDSDSPMAVEQIQRIFTQNVYGRVSDHTGIYGQFGLRNSNPEGVEGGAQHQLYLVGSHSGDQAYRGYKFEHVSDNQYRLITMLGAAQDMPEAELKPHRFYLTDKSGQK